MLSLLRQSRATLFCFALCSVFTIGPAYGDFTTILNIPPDPNIGDNQSIGSHTQLNLHDFGVIDNFFDAGDPNGTSTHVEVNISGGLVGRLFNANSGSVVNISGGEVGLGFDADSGSVVNISGGSFVGFFFAFDGSVVNISGGSVGGFFEAFGGSMVNISGGSVGNDFDANGGSVVNISGGSVGDFFDAFDGSVVNISGGSVGVFFNADSGSEVNISGGSVGSSFDADVDSEVNISGGSVGNSFTADSGSVVYISGGSVGSSFDAATDSEVNISGGSFGSSFDANDGSTLNISGGEYRLDGVLIGGLGTVGNMLEFNLPDGSVLSGTLADGTPFAFASLDSDSIDDGTLTLIAAAIAPVGPAVITLPSDLAPLGIRTGQTLVVNNGGILGDNFNAGWGSVVEVNAGGQVGNNLEAVGAQVTISGGSVGNDFDAYSGSVVTISGGSVGDDFDAFSGSEVNLFGTEFVLDGVDITALLTVNDPNAITVRDVTLSGLLADGSPFSFDLNSTNAFPQDYFDPGALLTVTLVGPGDFDGNLVVDGADFLKWQRGESPDPLSSEDLAAWEANYGTGGAPPEPGDFDGNGVVDGSDFLAWQRGLSPDPLSSADLAVWEANYGTSGAPLSSDVAAVPEPSCLLLLATGIVALIFVSHRAH